MNFYISPQVDEIAEEERERLEGENRVRLERQQEKLDSELNEQLEELDKKHAYRREQRRQDVLDEHEAVS